MSKKMDGNIQHEKAFEFLSGKYGSKVRFSKEELRKYTGWTDSTFTTYWGKQIKPLLIKRGEDRYIVSEAFRRVGTWDRFKNHMSQVRKLASDYKTYSYDKVLLFEFFMPLANEEYLRNALDALFYKDSVLARLKTIAPSKLKERIEMNSDEDKEKYHERICEWISEKFGGYSINHVNGRFRADDLKYWEETRKGSNLIDDRYIIDETTAVVRFIFPCGKKCPSKLIFSEDFFDSLDSEVEDERTQRDAELIRWFFYRLFVQSIIEVINGEDEIWLLESGLRNQLHIWSIQRA